MKLAAMILTFIAAMLTVAIAARDDNRDENAIRRIFKAHEFKEGRQMLIDQGDKLFPIYVRILSDKSVTSREISCIFGVLSAVKADRSRFLEPAVTNLAHTDSDVRGTAVILLGQIGSERDTAPIVALLADTDFTVGVAAAVTLQTIGGPRELAALNTWLVVSKPENYSKEYQGSYESLRKNVTKARDELKTRLEKAKKEP